MTQNIITTITSELTSGQSNNVLTIPANHSFICFVKQADGTSGSVQLADNYGAHVTISAGAKDDVKEVFDGGASGITISATPSTSGLSITLKGILFDENGAVISGTGDNSNSSTGESSNSSGGGGSASGATLVGYLNNNNEGENYQLYQMPGGWRRVDGPGGGWVQDANYPWYSTDSTLSDPYSGFPTGHYIVVCTDGTEVGAATVEYNVIQSDGVSYYKDDSNPFQAEGNYSSGWEVEFN